MSTTSKKRYRARLAATGDHSPWFASIDDLHEWMRGQHSSWWSHRVTIEEGSAIRATKETDVRKHGHTHPPRASGKCRICGV